MTKKQKKPWPTKDVMYQIYDLNLWGGQDFDFYSGEGSHKSSIITPYITTVSGFLNSFNTPLIVCDLGCGDFNIGQHLVKHSQYYFAIDIAENLITRNKELYKIENLEFKCLDISKDQLPSADCIILRQVLQHLSNPEIQNIVNKLSDYKYIILTEHLPIGDFIPNLDIISGQGIRLKQNSGVNILVSPFNLKISEEEKLDEYVLQDNKGRITTIVYKTF